MVRSIHDPRYNPPPPHPDELVTTGKPALVAEIFRQLPDVGSPFPSDERQRWRAALDAALDLMYPPPTPTEVMSWRDRDGAS